jgi:hypothetical protein
MKRIFSVLASASLHTAELRAGLPAGGKFKTPPLAYLIQHHNTAIADATNLDNLSKIVIQALQARKNRTRDTHTDYVKKGKSVDDPNFNFPKLSGKILKTPKKSKNKKRTKGTLVNHCDHEPYVII